MLFSHTYHLDHQQGQVLTGRRLSEYKVLQAEYCLIHYRAVFVFRKSGQEVLWERCGDKWDYTHIVIVNSLKGN